MRVEQVARVLAPRLLRVSQPTTACCLASLLLLAAGTFQYSDKLRPPVPTANQCATERAALGKREEKNFITSNAVENILAVPKRDPEPIDWLKKPHFGQTPPYLEKIKSEIKDEYDYISSMQQQANDAIPPGMHQLPEDERTQLVLALKAKWDAVNKQYQQASHPLPRVPCHHRTHTHAHSWAHGRAIDASCPAGSLLRGRGRSERRARLARLGSTSTPAVVDFGP